MVTLDRVSFSYGDTPIVTDFSLTLPDTGAVCLFGASGCGKTTLLRLIAGLEAPAAGRIIRPENTRVAMVFQDDRLAPWLTVRQNIEFVLTEPNAELVEDCLRAVSLTDAADLLPDELSGGMRRRVALARALAFGGNLLLLDEPFNGLDEVLKAEIAAALRKRFADCPIILVTHSLEEAKLFDALVIDL